MKVVATFSGVNLPSPIYISLMHIRNRHLREISYVRWASRSSYSSLMHIRNRLLRGISYVRWQLGGSYSSLMHIRNRLLHGISYVRQKLGGGNLSMMHIRNRVLHEISYVRQQLGDGYSSMMHIRNRLLHGISYVRCLPAHLLENVFMKAITICDSIVVLFSPASRCFETYPIFTRKKYLFTQKQASLLCLSASARL